MGFSGRLLGRSMEFCIIIMKVENQRALLFEKKNFLHRLITNKTNFGINENAISKKVTTGNEHLTISDPMYINFHR